MRLRNRRVPSSRLHPLSRRALSLKVSKTLSLRLEPHNTPNKRHSMINSKTMVQGNRISMEVRMSLLLQSRSLREPASRKMGKSISFSFPFFRQACVLFLFLLILPFPHLAALLPGYYNKLLRHVGYSSKNVCRRIFTHSVRAVWS